MQDNIFFTTMNITPGSLSWIAFLEMGERFENSPNS